MALVDLAIIGLSIGFAVLSLIKSWDGDAITSTARSSSVSETKLPGIDDVSSVMDRFSGESEPVIASAVATQYDEPSEEEDTDASEIPEFDEVEEEGPKMTKIECPNCSTVISIEEKGAMQTLTCDSCGFSGELEV